jgi:hypothetical protein
LKQTLFLGLLLVPKLILNGCFVLCSELSDGLSTSR